MVIALVFSSVEVASATESTDFVWGGDPVVVDNTGRTDDTGSTELDVGEAGVPEYNEDEELTIPAGVWSDEEPFFTDDVPEETESQLFQVFRIARASGIVPTYQETYNLMIALKEKYPEGMTWTNFEPYGSNGELGEYYRFQGGAVKGASLGVGCAAFVFILSDEAFDTLPARTLDKGSFGYEDIKVGDILRVNNNSHFVIVLKVSTGGVIVAEANYNKSVHWGRAISKDAIMEADFLITRYPLGYTEDDNADEIAHEDTEGLLHWTLTNGGVLTISGTGDMMNYTTEDRPSWNDYNDNINTVIIENGITSIGNYAFYESNALTVYIPDGVTSIGTGAFQSSNLVAVTIPGTTLSVGSNAFRSCENLTSASITEGVQTIGDNAFRACTSITYLDFPASVTYVGVAAFTSCNAVVQIRFAPSTGKVTIDDSAFAQCQRLISVTLPQGLTKISNYMFQSCTSLWGIYIPANVTDIGENPFTSTGIQYGGTIYFGGSQTTWKSIGGQFILNTMPKAIIEYEVDFDNPFAIDPNDPGDFEPTDEPDDSNNSGDLDNSVSTDTSTNTDTETEDTSNTNKPGNTYKYAKEVKDKSLYDSNNKRVDIYELNKKGILIYKGKKIKNVKEVGYLISGDLVYRLKNGTVKQINHVTLKTRTLYKKSIKKLIRKQKFVTQVKTKSNKKKSIKK